MLGEGQAKLRSRKIASPTKTLVSIINKNKHNTPFIGKFKTKTKVLLKETTNKFLNIIENARGRTNQVKITNYCFPNQNNSTN